MSWDGLDGAPNVYTIQPNVDIGSALFIAEERTVVKMVVILDTEVCWGRKCDRKQVRTRKILKEDINNQTRNINECFLVLQVMEEGMEGGNEVERKDHLLQRIKKEPGDVEEGEWEEDDEVSTFQMCHCFSATAETHRSKADGTTGVL